MSDRKLSIFDMDGTLLDSMPYWENVGRTYLEGKGITVPDDFEESIQAMTLTESALYMKRHFGIQDSETKIIEDALKNITQAYKFIIPAKSGMKKVVKKEKDAGNRLVILTSSEKKCAVAALKRTGLYPFFDHIYTADELGIGKNDPQIYQLVCKQNGVTPSEAHCFEDALYAVIAAKKAGCYVTAVYDSTMKEEWEQIKQISDEQIITNMLI